MSATQAVENAFAEYVRATSAMDWEARVAVFAADAVCRDPVGSPAILGHDGARTFAEGIGKLFRAIDMTLGRVFAVDGGGAAEWTIRGVGQNGREVTFSGIDVIEIDDDGKIRSLDGYWDPTPVMAVVQA